MKIIIVIYNVFRDSSSALKDFSLGFNKGNEFSEAARERIILCLIIIGQSHEVAKCSP